MAGGAVRQESRRPEGIQVERVRGRVAFRREYFCAQCRVYQWNGSQVAGSMTAKADEA